MAWISVSGACSRSGKTALCETLLRRLGAGTAAAVKFTTTDDVFERCPRGAPCVVCDIAVPFRLVDDDQVLGQAGTDTARLAAAGASRVLWAIAKRGAARPAWQAVRRALDGARCVVMEGSTIVDLARPDLHVFVAHPFLSPARWKPGSAALAARADAVVVNLSEGEARAASDEVLAALEAAGAQGRPIVADVRRELHAWAPQLAARLDALRGLPEDADHRRA